MITVALSEQLIQSCHMIAFGVATMFLFDSLTAISHQAKWHKYKKTATDFILICICSSYFYIVCIVHDYGLLRNYRLFSLLLGVVIYYIWLRHPCNRICWWIAKILLWGSGWIRRILLYPWKLFHRYFVLYVKKKLQQMMKRRKNRVAPELQATDELEEII